MLESGDPVAAAAIVAEMTEFLPRLPPEMPAEELAEASRLLEHCTTLEKVLRQRVLASLQRLGATRRATAYRQYGGRP